MPKGITGMKKENKRLEGNNEEEMCEHILM